MLKRDAMTPSHTTGSADLHLPLPTPAQQRWQDYEVGIVYHFDIPVYHPRGWTWEPAYRETLDPQLYNPVRLDTDQWLEAARAAGAKYAIFTATHMGGFRQWQSEAYPYGCRQTGWRSGKGDVVADFVESCRRCGIAPGLYVSVRFNAHCGVANTLLNHGEGGDPDQQREYLRRCEQMVHELCSRYGELAEFWFDGGVLTPQAGGPDVLPIFERHQPDSVFYHSPQRADHRWAGSESGTAGDPCWATLPDVPSQYRAHQPQANWLELLRHGDPDGRAWVPAMADTPIRDHEWFWRPGEDDKVFAPDDPVRMYCESVGRNSNLVIGATPDRDGLIPAADMTVLAEFGRQVRQRLAAPLAETSGCGHIHDLRLPRPGPVDAIVIMEDIARGERVRRFEVSGQLPGNQWQILAHGTSIGHKRICQVNVPEVAAIRLTVTDSVGAPQIRRLAAFATP